MDFASVCLRLRLQLKLQLQLLLLLLSAQPSGRLAWRRNTASLSLRSNGDAWNCQRPGDEQSLPA